ncbi:MAG: hypothetical protein ACPGXY_05740 [Alphaproteobacteria bacterium]
MPSISYAWEDGDEIQLKKHSSSYNLDFSETDFLKPFSLTIKGGDSSTIGLAVFQDNTFTFKSDQSFSICMKTNHTFSDITLACEADLALSGTLFSLGAFKVLEGRLNNAAQVIANSIWVKTLAYNSGKIIASVDSRVSQYGFEVDAMVQTAGAFFGVTADCHNKGVIQAHKGIVFMGENCKISKKGAEGQYLDYTGPFTPGKKGFLSDARLVNDGTLDAGASPLVLQNFISVDHQEKAALRSSDIFIETPSVSRINKQIATWLKTPYGRVVFQGHTSTTGTVFISAADVSINKALQGSSLYILHPKMKKTELKAAILFQNAFVQKLVNKLQFQLTGDFGRVSEFEAFKRKGLNEGLTRTSDPSVLRPPALVKAILRQGYLWSQDLVPSIVENSGSFKVQGAVNLGGNAIQNTGFFGTGQGGDNLCFTGPGKVQIGQPGNPANPNKIRVCLTDNAGDVSLFAKDYALIMFLRMEEYAGQLYSGSDSGLDVVFSNGNTVIQGSMLVDGEFNLVDGADCSSNIILKKPDGYHAPIAAPGEKSQFKIEPGDIVARKLMIKPSRRFIVEPGARTISQERLIVGSQGYTGAVKLDGFLAGANGIDLKTDQLSGNGALASKGAAFLQGAKLDLSKLNIQTDGLGTYATQSLTLPAQDFNQRGMLSLKGPSITFTHNTAAGSISAIATNGALSIQRNLISRGTLSLKSPLAIQQSKNSRISAESLESESPLAEYLGQIQATDFKAKHNQILGGEIAAESLSWTPHSADSLRLQNVNLTAKTLFLDAQIAEINRSTLNLGYLKTPMFSDLGISDSSISIPEFSRHYGNSTTLNRVYLKANKLSQWHNLTMRSSTFTGPHIYAYGRDLVIEDNTFSARQLLFDMQATRRGLLSGNSFNQDALQLNLTNGLTLGDNHHRGSNHSVYFKGAGDPLKAIAYVDSMLNVTKTALQMPDVSFDIPEALTFEHPDISLTFGEISANHSVVSGNTYKMSALGDFTGIKPEFYGDSVTLSSQYGHFYAPMLQAQTENKLDIYGYLGINVDGDITGYNTTSTTRRSGPWYNRRKVTTEVSTPIFSYANIKAGHLSMTSETGRISAAGANMSSRLVPNFSSSEGVDLDAVVGFDSSYQKKSMYFGGRMSRIYDGKIHAKHTQLVAPGVRFETPEVTGREPILPHQMSQAALLTTLIDRSNEYHERVSYGRLKPTKENIASLAAMIIPTPFTFGNPMLQLAADHVKREFVSGMVMHKGNVFKAGRDVFSPDSGKKLLMNGIYMGTDGLSPIGLGMRAGARSVLYGENFGEAMLSEVRSSVADAVTANIAHKLGDLHAAGHIGDTTKILGHFGNGAFGGFIRGDNNPWAAGVGAAAGEWGAETFKAPEVGKIFGAVTGALAGDARAGYQMAMTTIENNYEKHKNTLQESIFYDGATILDLDGYHNDVVYGMDWSDYQADAFEGAKEEAGSILYVAYSSIKDTTISAASWLKKAIIMNEMFEAAGFNSENYVDYNVAVKIIDDKLSFPFEHKAKEDSLLRGQCATIGTLGYTPKFIAKKLAKSGLGKNYYKVYKKALGRSEKVVDFMDSMGSGQKIGAFSVDLFASYYVPKTVALTKVLQNAAEIDSRCVPLISFY